MTPSPITADLLITGATAYTCQAGAADAGRIDNGAIAIAGEQIVAVAPATELATTVNAAETINAAGTVVTPGFVDCHTHVVFGGSRATEYAAKCSMSAEQVKQLGIPTGIVATMEMTRRESEAELLASASARIAGMLACGTTTIESKSGYGLNVADELKMLRVNAALAEACPVDIISTFLGAHAVPPEHDAESYTALVINEMIPQVAAEGLAEFCDVFCEEGYFTADQSRRILEAGLDAGMAAKIHTDEYADIGGSVLAAQLPAISADHLNCTPPAVMAQLAEAGVIGVVMPALDFAVAHERPFDFAAMKAAGMTLALATDICPGCWCESMQVVMQLACRNYGFTPAEALLAGTIHGARAINRSEDRGSLEAGKLADILILDVPTLDEVVYRLGNNAVQTIIRRGRVIDIPPHQ